MKEEPGRLSPSPKLISKVGSTFACDEIFSTLLKINNLDSTSSIKDESLDIDLTACVPVPSALCNGGNGGNSMSSDFWRVLDESAQNAAETDVGGHTTEQTSFQSKFICPDPPAPPLVPTVVKSSIQVQRGKLNEPKIKSDRVKKSKIKASKSKPADDNTHPPLTSSNSSTSQDLNSIQVGNDIKAFIPSIEIVQQASAETSAQLKCDHCDDVFSNLDELALHQANLINLAFKCPECDRQFEAENALKKHVKTHRTLEARKDIRKKCPDCGKCLKLGSMWMHRKIHSDNKKYACDICGQKFVQKINLTHHSRVHTSEKPFECPECQKRFQERSHLQRHQKYHAQTRSYRCDKCGKMYKTERCLKVHNLVHLEQRPFACQVCDKSFISNSKLKQHSNIHTGERPFKCNYCPRDFTNFPNWLKHTRRRHRVDHKTGEQLENIPSYCSKKSSVTVSAIVKAKSTSTTKESIKDVKIKSVAKRRKKCPTLLPKVEKGITGGTTNPPPPLKPKTRTVGYKTPILPKIIKQEPYFSDVHCLSITSAEELIMEQALEMEECGLYDSENRQKPNSAPLEFQIKNEYIDIKQEFVGVKQGYDNNHQPGSSLESSPFSSPASVEYAVSSLNPASGTVCYIPLTFHTSNSIFGEAITTSHLEYLPMTMRSSQKPTTFHANQTLPSVDTLLFNTSYFNNRA